MPLQTWRGHGIFAADGSKIHLPHELLLVGYQAPNKGCQEQTAGISEEVLFRLS